jgi:hypothetical protein
MFVSRPEWRPSVVAPVLGASAMPFFLAPRVFETVPTSRFEADIMRPLENLRGEARSVELRGDPEGAEIRVPDLRRTAGVSANRLRLVATP